MKDRFDVVVVGAGAAGLAALERLTAHGVEAIGVEAQDRLGGRAHTFLTRGLALDLGCGWLHSADENVLARRFDEDPRFTVDKTPPAWGRQDDAEGAHAEERRAFAQAQAAFEQRVEDAARTGRDRPASDLLDPASPWNGRLNAISGYYNGAELERVSVLDYDAYIDTGINWRVREGYGAALLGQSAGEIVTGCAAQRIDRSEADVLRVQTSKGTLTATTVILTVSSALLAQERPGIYPAAEDKLQDASLLPLGLADKVYFSVGRPEDIGCERHVAGGLRSARTGSYYLQPLGQPVIEAYFGGAFAGELERAGAAAMTAAALEELTRALGRDACRSLEPLAQTAWAADPWSLGSYSHALPGGSAARGRLAAPLEDRIFFAGEATHPRFFSTAHGAWESGRRAADEALAALGGGCAPLASAGGS